MSGAVALGLLLILGGGVLEGFPGEHREEVDDDARSDIPLYRSFTANRRFTRTGVLLQALGTVLFVMGLLAFLL